MAQYDGSMDSSSAVRSRTLVQSPTLIASELQYSSRYGVVEDQKVRLTPLAASQYMFAPSHSLSPTTSTPSSTSSTSLALVSYAFTFPEGTSFVDRSEFYRRPMNPPQIPRRARHIVHQRRRRRQRQRPDTQRRADALALHARRRRLARARVGRRALRVHVRLAAVHAHGECAHGDVCRHGGHGQPACGTEFAAAQACKVDTGHRGGGVEGDGGVGTAPWCGGRRGLVQ